MLFEAYALGRNFGCCAQIDQEMIRLCQGGFQFGFLGELTGGRAWHHFGHAVVIFDLEPYEISAQYRGPRDSAGNPFAEKAR